MDTIQKLPSRKRPGVITVLAVFMALQGISDLVAGIQAIITRRILFPSQPLPNAASDYLLLLIPSHLAQIVFSYLVGILFLVLAWELGALKPWAYWITLIVCLPSQMIYDLSKVLLLIFHVLPPTMFEPPDILVNAVPFIIELVFFVLILRKNVRNSLYPLKRSLKNEQY